jgi:hypothetical protein
VVLDRDGKFMIDPEENKYARVHYESRPDSSFLIKLTDLDFILTT